MSYERFIIPKGYIDGKWVSADSGKTYPNLNPATHEKIADMPDMGQAETQKAIDAASKAFPLWKSKTAKERSTLLRRWFELLMKNQDDLGELMTREQGKPLAEAKGEVAYAASFLEWFAEEAKRIYGDIIPSHKGDARIVVLKQPIGVVAAITPWNFPFAMITRKIGPALAAGCTTVIKPAGETPLSALAMAKLAEEAGIPAGVINIVVGSNSSLISEVIMKSSEVRKLTFTGSTRVGKILMRQSADTLKKVSLELGGNAPFIVFDDADLDKAIQGALASKYRNTGQTCVCANRFYVQDGVYDKFAEKLKQAVSAFKVGNGLEGGVTQGPLINKGAFDKVKEHVEDATGKGGKVISGGKPHALGGTFFEPTIITEANKDMLIATEETFGPVAAIFRFKTEEEVIKLANATEYGLAAYFYTRDIGRAWRVGEALETGIVGINEGIISTEVAPFGGVKESGFGREGSKYGIEDYLEIKYMLMGGLTD